MHRLAVLLVGLTFLLLVLTAPSTAVRQDGSRRAFSGPTVDELISSCPPAAEIALIRSEFSLTFEGDPTAGSLVCRAEDGSADLTHLQERAIQALRAMKALSFARPLPWTSQGLYGWLNETIDGIRFRSDITYSFCCDPPGVINIQTRNLFAAQSPYKRWIDPQSGVGLMHLVGLYIHEARHNQGKGHTCGSNDATVTEMGSWGVQYYYELWLGLYGGQFLATTSPTATYYRDMALSGSASTMRFICSPPVADLAMSIESSPNPVPSGGRLQTRLTIRNAGPESAPEAYVAFDETANMAVVESATASQGSCLVGVEGEPRGTACALGPLAPGAVATITIVQRVTGREGGVIQAPVARALSVAPYVTGPVRDANLDDNTAGFSVSISESSAPSTATCRGVPKGGVVKVGPSAGGRVVGTSKGDVLCSGGGVTTLEGRAGDDVLRGSSGSDRVLAGAGNDTVYVHGGGIDSVSCGSGRDRVFANPADRVASDCETVRRK